MEQVVVVCRVLVQYLPSLPYLFKYKLHLFCTKSSPKKSGATYAQKKFFFNIFMLFISLNYHMCCIKLHIYETYSMLPLCICYLDCALHFHVCACTHMYAATMCMLSIQDFAPLGMGMHVHAMTITRKMQRQTMRHIVNHKHMAF